MRRPPTHFDVLTALIASQIASALAYRDISDRLALLDVRFKDYVEAPDVEIPLIQPTDIDFERHLAEGLMMYSNFNPNQKEAADEILRALRNATRGYFFIDGPGGSGKTYLYNALYGIAIGEHHRRQCVAWTGIAANLLPGGRTVNSVFKLNMADGNRS